MDNQVEATIQHLEAQILRAARTLVEQGIADKALDVYREIVRAFPYRADVEREMATLLIEQASVAWLPWVKNRYANEAVLAIGRANALEPPTGDSWYILAQGNVLLGRSREDASIKTAIQHAFVEFDRCIVRGEKVSTLYLATCEWLAQDYERQGQIEAAIRLYQIIAGEAALEAVGQIPSGSTKPERTTVALSHIRRLQASPIR